MAAVGMRFVVVFEPDLEIVQREMCIRTWVAANLEKGSLLNERLVHSI